ncbi:hypothetical protein CYMTET_23273, partial [Cymbomonas tetramitiformis]
MWVPLRLLANRFGTCVSLRNTSLTSIRPKVILPQRCLLHWSAVGGTVEVLAPQYRHLSPAVGALLAHSEYLSVLIEGGDPQSPTVLLAKSLFHRPNSTGPWRATRNLSLPTASLTPKTVAQLVALLNAVPDSARDATLTHCLKAWHTQSGNTRSSVQRAWELLQAAHEEELIFTERATSSGVAGGASLATPLLLAFLWLKADSRECLLQYLLALRKAVPDLIPDDRAHPLITSTPAIGSLKQHHPSQRSPEQQQWLRAHLRHDALQPLDRLSWDAVRTAAHYE